MNSVVFSEMTGIKHHNVLRDIRKHVPGARRLMRKANDGKMHAYYELTDREMFTLLTGKRGVKMFDYFQHRANPEIYKYAVSPIRHRIFELNEQRKTQLWQNRNHNLDVDVESTKQELKKMEELLNEALSI